jgi:hypothetical protein
MQVKLGSEPPSIMLCWPAVIVSAAGVMVSKSGA